MPNVSGIHTNRVLTSMAAGFPMGNYISEGMVPNVTVSKSSDIYMIFDAARRNIAQVNDLRAPGTPSHKVDFDTSEDTYSVTDHSLSALIPIEEQSDADAPLDPIADKVQFIKERLMVNQEVDLKAKMDAALTGAQQHIPTVNWASGNYATSDPIADIRTAINTITNASGFAPTDMGMDSLVWQALSLHPDLVDLVKYTGGNDRLGNPSTAGVAEFFELERITVTKALLNTAAPGVATPVITRAWGDDVYLSYKTTAPEPRKHIPTFAKRFVWDISKLASGFGADSEYQKPIKSTWVEAGRYYDQKIVMKEAGYRIEAVLT